MESAVAEVVGVTDSGTRSDPGVLARAFAAAATAVGILGATLIVLLTPAWIHPALDASGSAEILGFSPAETRALSDATVAELVAGPGTFAFAAPGDGRFYGPDEAAHLRDVRVVLYAFLALVAIAVAGLAAALLRGSRDPRTWRAVARGATALAVGVVAVGAFALVAFEAVFELFHRIFFPGGNWAFDPSSQRLVQLYPTAFWQLTSAALGLLAATAALVVRLLALRRARALGASSAAHSEQETVE